MNWPFGFIRWLLCKLRGHAWSRLSRWRVCSRCFLQQTREHDTHPWTTLGGLPGVVPDAPARSLLVKSNAEREV